MNNRQKPTPEGLKAEQEAKDSELIMREFQNGIKYVINPARESIGMPAKKY